MEEAHQLNSNHILQILHECTERLGLDLDSKVLREINELLRHYNLEHLPEFIRDLQELGTNTGVVLVKKEVSREDFELFIEQFDAPMVLFLKGKDHAVPALIETNSKHKKDITLLYHEGNQILDFKDIADDQIIKNNNGKLIFLSVFAYNSVVGSDTTGENQELKLTPINRLIKLLSADKKDILYVYIYAFIIGITTLVLPLGIQAAIELISGGVYSTSIYFLIGIIIVGVLGAGVLQVFQITIVEMLQRRVFAKAAFEFAYRVPRIKVEAIRGMYFPELMNRFFDVLTIQKGLPKLLIDLSTGLIQIAFGLLLLSFYHPFFIFFGLVLVTLLFIIFRITGPLGLKSSIIESKYKYKAVYWLEELARALYSFKLAGTTDLPLQKTDYYVNNYLRNRKKHFGVLISQFSYILLFKALVTAGLLILGTVLVVNREITLGQFVASEVIIILILNSVEKIISYTDVVYDMLTAVDKISHVTDLPLEKTGGIDLNVKDFDGFDIKLKKVFFSYSLSKKPILENINLNIRKGERICISGVGGSGKTTLINTLSGMHLDYEGSVTFNHYSLKDLDRTHIRDHIGKNVSIEDIFEGTILENILVGKPLLDERDAIDALEMAGLLDDVNALNSGLNSQIMSGGKGYSETFVQRLILSRCIVKRPNLLILNDFFNSFTKNDRLELIQKLTAETLKWTLIIVSNDPIIMSACDRVLYLSSGKIIADGPFNEVIQIEEVIQNLN